MEIACQQASLLLIVPFCVCFHFVLFTVIRYSLFLCVVCCVVFSLILYLWLAYISFETSYVFSLSLHAMNIMWLFL